MGKREPVKIAKTAIVDRKAKVNKAFLDPSTKAQGQVPNLSNDLTRSIDWSNDPITRTVGRIKLAVTNASVNHDHYLYGEKG